MTSRDAECPFVQRRSSTGAVIRIRTQAGLARLRSAGRRARDGVRASREPHRAGGVGRRAPYGFGDIPRMGDRTARPLVAGEDLRRVIDD